MKPVIRRLPVLNSLVTIKDDRLDDYPDVTGTGQAWWTPSSISVCCLPDSEGETEITFGLSTDVGLDSAPIVDRTLATSSRRLSVQLVPRREIMSVAVNADLTRVRVWSDGRRDSEWLIIGIG